MERVVNQTGENRAGYWPFLSRLVGSTGDYRNLIWLLSVFAMALAGWAILLLTFGKPWESRSSATVIMMSGACFVGGCFIGFLFGIPKREGGQAGASASYRQNTNLEEISDWLTKIVVGVSLTQVDTIVRHGRDLIGYFEVQIGGNGPILTAALVFFIVNGFMFSYLWTTLFYVGDLNRAAQDLTRGLDDLKGEIERDAAAKSKVVQYLDPRNHLSLAFVVDMKRSIGSASAAARAEILSRATTLRSEKWRTDRPALEPLVAVLEAITEAEPDNHVAFGELGFVLKDKAAPDNVRAERMLSTAIQLRDQAKESGWLNYEFNRALCRIELGSGDTAAVLDDLRKAAPAWRATYSEAPVAGWLKAKNIDPASLAPRT